MTLLRDTPSYGVYFCVYHFAVQGLGQLMYPTTVSQQQQQQQQQQGHHQHQQRLAVRKEEPLLVQASSVWEGAEQAASKLSLVQHSQHLITQQHQTLQDTAQQSAHQQQQQQQTVQQQKHPGASRPVVQFIAGGLAGAIAWMSIYPIDVVKCRMQVG
jgi:hypothetical protein